MQRCNEYTGAESAYLLRAARASIVRGPRTFGAVESGDGCFVPTGGVV